MSEAHTETIGNCAHLDLVLLRYALGYADNQTNFTLDGLKNGISSRGRWDVEDGSIRTCFPDSLWWI